MGGAGLRESGVISVRYSLSLGETVKNLLTAVERRGMTVFARVDHARAAEELGLRLRPAELFVFGYPEAEAPLIEKVALLGLDLPRRVLLWEDEHRGVWMTYNDPVWVGRRHDLDADIIPKLEAIAASLAGIAAEATIAKGGVTGGMTSRLAFLYYLHEHHRIRTDRRHGPRRHCEVISGWPHGHGFCARSFEAPGRTRADRRQG